MSLQVREIKTAREREQEMARENMELLKMKQQKDRSQDLTVSSLNACAVSQFLIIRV